MKQQKHAVRSTVVWEVTSKRAHAASVEREGLRGVRWGRATCTKGGFIRADEDRFLPPFPPSFRRLYAEASSPCDHAKNWAVRNE